MSLPVVFLRFAALCGLSLLFTNCAGYRLGSDRPARMEDIATVAVPVFRNNTLEPRSAVLVTNAVIASLQNDGTYKLVDSSRADAILRGTIRAMERRQLRGARTNTLRTRELGVRLIVDYVIEDASGATLLRGTAEGDTSLFLDPNFQLTERQGIDDAAQRVATAIVSRMAEGWGEEAFPHPPTAGPVIEKSRRRGPRLPGALGGD